MLPPPSEALANGTIPAATAAAAPPLDPPGVRSSAHGLRVGPHASGCVVGRLPNSGLFVRPAMTSPAALYRDTSVVSAVSTIAASLSATLPFDSVCPAKLVYRSLSRNGTPRNGPSGNGVRGGDARASVEPLDDHGVQCRVEPFDALDRRVEQLDQASPHPCRPAPPGRRRPSTVSRPRVSSSWPVVPRSVPSPGGGARGARRRRTTGRADGTPAHRRPLDRLVPPRRRRVVGRDVPPGGRTRQAALRHHRQRARPRSARPRRVPASASSSCR